MIVGQTGCGKTTQLPQYLYEAGWAGMTSSSLPLLFFPSSPFHSILFYSILFYSILFYSILFYSILFYSILFYFSLSYLSLSPTSSAEGRLIGCTQPRRVAATSIAARVAEEKGWLFSLFFSLFFIYLFFFIIFFFLIDPYLLICRSKTWRRSWILHSI